MPRWYSSRTVTRAGANFIDLDGDTYFDPDGLCQLTVALRHRVTASEVVRSWA
jgi:hypothetical protein